MEMSKDSKEHLSQLMDGELGGDTGRFILRRLEASGELRGAWARYHLIRDCMRYQDRGLADYALGDRVRQAIDGMDAPQGGVSALSRRWLRPVAGFAVAAAVAMVAVISVAPNLPTASGVDGQQAALESQPFTSPNILSRNLATRPVNFSGQEAGDAGKLNSYLLRHYQVAGASGGNGFVSFVPIVVTKAPDQRQADDPSGSGQKSSQERESAQQ